MLNAVEYNGKPFTELYKKLINPDEDEGKIDLLMYEMMRLGLIKYEDKNGVPTEWCFVILDIKGQRIKDAGGFLKVKIQQMNDEEKIHQLLQYVFNTDGNRFGWSPSDLTPAFSEQLNEDEIRYLCQILIDGNDASDLSTKDGFEIGITDKTKSAFYGKKYLRKNAQSSVSPTQTVTVANLQQVIGSTVHGNVSQSAADQSVLKATSTENGDTSTLFKILKNIVAPIVVLVLGGLILNNCFGIAP